MRVLSRDAFARHQIVRHHDYDSTYCDWCGQERHTPQGRAYAYRYGVDSDGSTLRRPQWEQFVFCCKSCHDIFHA